MSRQVAVDEVDRDRPFADRGRDALDRLVPHVTRREDAGDARFEQIRLARRAASP